MPNEPQDLSHLSPEVVLGNTSLSREELLKAAAEAPDTRLILPDLTVRPSDTFRPTRAEFPLPPLTPPIASPVAESSSPVAPAEQIIAAPKPVRAEFPLPPLAPPITGLVAPFPLPVAPAKEIPVLQGPVLASLSLSPAIPLVPVVSLPKKKPKKPLATPDIEIIKPKRAPALHSKSVLPLVVGLFSGALVLAVLGAVAFILVQRGVRLPLLYTFASHLQPTGLSQRDAAVVAVGKQSSYKLNEGSFQSLTGTPSLLASLSSGWVHLPEGKTYADERFHSTKSEISLLFRSGVPATIIFPLVKPISNQMPEIVAFKASSLSVTLQPIPLPVLLNSITAETGYTAATADALHVARYTYALDPLKVEVSLPAASTITNPTLIIEFGWGSDLPRSSTLHGSLTINGTTADYSSEAVYVGWGEALPAPFQPLDVQKIDPITLDTLKAELGASTASSLKSVAFTPLVPANVSVPSLSSAVTASPPPPSTARTAQITSRDSKRKSDLSLLRTAIAGYKTTTGEYPISNGLEQVQASNYLFKALVPTYLTAMPVDPLSTVYWYEYQSDGKTFILRSVAEDSSDPLAKLGKAYHYFIVTN